jgi:tetrahydromethanopterin S-methyltransferase subunit B
VTLVKKGVHVMAGKTLNLDFIMKPGSGAVVTEYAAAVLSREEIEARLKKLETQVAELQKALQAQQAAYPIRHPD